ncbi:hypothetical protein B0T14DRAFT_568023 [Immersiella caudata]|uniref:Uncharacterized protein n=1 Tax=Immersiella caudata TaxID=314043 RepID=A0AA39WJ80_9PEZI|nr:hypothetical protein B0T14DRAFT_568023 [Immersiella caudata]
MQIDTSESQAWFPSRIPTKGLKLVNQKEWPEWYTWLEICAKTRGIWELVNPDAPTAPNPFLKSRVPTIDKLIESMQAKQDALYQMNLELWEEAGPEYQRNHTKPVPIQITKEEVTAQHKRLRTESAAQITITSNVLMSYRELQTYVDETVHISLRQLAAQAMLQEEDGHTIQNLVRFLRSHLAPTPTSLASQARH